MDINKVVGLFSRALGVILLLMVALNAANAIGRYFFDRAIEGADEVLVYSMIWLVFLGAALVAQKDKHLRFDLLERILKEYRVRRVLFLVYNGMTFFVVIFVVFQSVQVIEKIGKVGQKSMALEIPMVIPHSAVLIGLLLIGGIAGVRVTSGLIEEFKFIFRRER